TVVILTLVKLLRDTEKSRGAKHPCGCIHASILAPQSHRKNTKTPYTVTGIIIHKLAASLFKPRGSKRGKKVAAYSPENTVYLMHVYNFTSVIFRMETCKQHFNEHTSWTN